MRRCRRWAVLPAILLATILTGVALAGPAAAGTITGVTPSTGLSNGQRITVTANFVSGDAYFVIAECTTAYRAGTACNGTTELGAPSPVPGLGRHSFSLTVNRTFLNADLTMTGGPGGITTCKGSSGSQCAVLLSTYDSSPQHLDRDRLVPISFTP